MSDIGEVTPGFAELGVRPSITSVPVGSPHTIGRINLEITMILKITFPNVGVVI